MRSRSDASRYPRADSLGPAPCVRGSCPGGRIPGERCGYTRCVSSGHGSMPIVDVELVAGPDGVVASRLAQSLADAVGRALGSPVGQTWVRLHILAREHYAENESSIELAELPVFVTVTDSHFKRTRLSVEEPVVRVKRRFAVATGCSARLSWHFPAGAMRGGAVGSPRWARMSRTVGPSVMKAMMRISPPQWVRRSDQRSRVILSSGTGRVSVLTPAIRHRKLRISVVCTNQEKLMRDAAINLRARPEQRELIDQAAQLLGKNRSDFMLEAACDKAQSVLLDQVFFKLDAEKFRQFTKLLDAPPRRNPGLERLMAVKAPWGKKSAKA